jgi:hypothetical protein
MPATEIDTLRPIATTLAVPTIDSPNAAAVAVVSRSLPRTTSITATIAGYA